MCNDQRGFCVCEACWGPIVKYKYNVQVYLSIYIILNMLFFVFVKHDKAYLVNALYSMLWNSYFYALYSNLGRFSIVC